MARARGKRNGVSKGGQKQGQYQAHVVGKEALGIEHWARGKRQGVCGKDKGKGLRGHASLWSWLRLKLVVIVVAVVVVVVVVESECGCGCC